MIPLSLKLANFMSYRGETGIDFSEIHLACISGANGAGKSSLLDAITWALWGKARTRHDNDLIAHGETEMAITFDFVARDQHYSVTRTRSSKGAGFSRIELQIVDPLTGNVTPITGARLAETQTRITELVQMSYETFTNSAFILQGQADSFTVKNATERKQILADILGLAYYDTLVDRAKEQRDVARQTHRDLNADITRLNELVELRPRVEAAHSQAVANRVTLETQVAAADSRHRSLDQQVAGIKRTRDEIAAAQNFVQRYRREREQAEASVRTLEVTLRQAEQTLAKRAEIEHGHAELDAAQVEEDRLNRIQEDHEKVRARWETVTKEIERERQALEKKLAGIEAKIEADRKEAANATLRENHVAALRQQIAGLGNPDRDRTNANERLNVLSERLGGLDAALKTLQTEIKKVEQKGKSLPQAGTACELCGTEMSAEAREQTRQSFLTTWRDLKAQRDVSEKERVVAQDERADLNTELDEIEARVGRVAALREELARANESLTRAKEAAIRIEEQRQQQTALRRKIDSADYAHAAYETAATLQDAMARLNHDPALLAETRAKRQTLAGYREQKAALDLAQHKADAARAQIAERRETITARTTDITAQETAIARLQADIAGAGEIEQQAANVQRELTAKRYELGEQIKHIGSLESDLRACERAADDLPKVNAEFQKAAEQISVYEELMTAFGKSGIQALIIEQVVPQLEDQANDLLGRMSDGRMSVRFKTQRSLRSRDKTIEALDIEIADGLGVRPYEMYSGGEAFRINFAIRVALSKVLAQRSGAQLRTLVIDEGFGSQDTAGRDHVIEAIRAIEKDFDRILVITHIEELKNAFPVRIDIEKTANGSKIVSMVQV